MNFCFQSVKMELWIFIFSSKIQISHSKHPLLFNPGHNYATLPNITIFLWTPIFKYATVMYSLPYHVNTHATFRSYESAWDEKWGHFGSIWGQIWWFYWRKVKENTSKIYRIDTTAIENIKDDFVIEYQHLFRVGSCLNPFLGVKWWSKNNNAMTLRLS